MYEKMICDKFGLDSSLVLKKPIRGKSGYTVGKLLEALISTNSIEEASDYLGYSINPIKQSIRELLHPIFDNRSKSFFNSSHSRATPWNQTLLLSIGFKPCGECKTIRKSSDFYLSKDNNTGKYSYCKFCCRIKASKQKYYIYQRTPDWSDLNAISKFYSNCPEGYEVDHIVPLRGKLVSGLHVVNNLQYLPILENRSKGNRFEA